MAFLSGWITGPRKIAQDPSATGLRRFVLAVQALLYHELALLVNFGVLLAMQQGMPNHVAMCTFALLWCMRLSAKLNLFFGVPQVGEQYLPAHLAYLGSYFRRGPVGLFFWASMAIASGSWLWIVAQAQRGAVVVNTGWILLAALLGLAIIEHLLMMLPVPLQRLWGWAMGSPHESSVVVAAVAVVPPVVPLAPAPTEAGR